METPEKAAAPEATKPNVDMLTAKTRKAEVQAQIAATQARIKKNEKEAAIAKKKAEEAQRKTDALNANRARRQAELQAKEALAAEREQRRQEQAARNAEARNNRKTTIQERRTNVEANNHASRLDAKEQSIRLAEEKKNFAEDQLAQRRQAHNESYANKKQAREYMGSSMDNFRNETTAEYNARIKAELEETAAAEAQLAELKSFEEQCAKVLSDHVEVKSGLLGMLKEAIAESTKSTLK